MLDCLKTLVDIGNNGIEEMNNSYLSMEKVGEIVEGQNYYYQEYKVNSNVDMLSYNLYNLNNLPEGSYVANIKNVYQGKFAYGENFRILIPKDKFNENINGQIDIAGKCKNYPIFYGEAPDGKQDYVLTYDSYGDIKGVFNININVNNGKIKVVKKDKDTEIKLEGIKFELVSENEKYKYEGTTDRNGEISFEKLFPGKYILKEIESLKEYKVCEEEFNFEVKYNSVIEFEVINELKKGNIKIIKFDKENIENKLEGVVFELYDENMELLETLVTDENGEIESDYYPSENKKYFIKEIKTTENYILCEDIIEVKMEDGKTLEYEITNEKIEISEVLEKPEKPVIKHNPIFEKNIIEEIPVQEYLKLPKTGM